MKGPTLTAMKTLSGEWECNMRIERHSIGVWVREDGCVFIPKSRTRPEHWTFGSLNAEGYATVKFKGKCYRVHRLVAECYIPNPERKLQVDHKDRNPANNRADNLRWATQSENQRNTKANDRVESRGGTHKYEDEKKYYREHQRLWRKRHPDYMKNYMANHRKMEVA